MRRVVLVLLGLLAACGGYGADDPDNPSSGATGLIVGTVERALDDDEADAMEQALGSRLRALGTRGSIEVEGDRLRIRLTDGDPKLVLVATETTGLLEFRRVLEVLPADAGEPTEDPRPDAEAVLAERQDGDVVLLYRLAAATLDGSVIERAEAQDIEGQWVVNLRFTKEGAVAFDALAASTVGQQLAIVVDGRVLSAPTIQEANFGGEAVISGGNGGMDEAEARGLASALNSAPLPAGVVEVRFRRA